MDAWESPSAQHKTLLDSNSPPPINPTLSPDNSVQRVQSPTSTSPLHGFPSNNFSAPSPPRPSIDLSKFKSSFETNHWSDNNALWRDHPVPEPRLPTKEEALPSAVSWDVSNYPTELSRFLGRQNLDTKNSLITLVTNNTFRNVCIHGPPGSGKTALVETFVKEFYTSNVEDGRITFKDCVYRTTGDKVAQNIRNFSKAVEKFKKHLDQKIKKYSIQPTMKCVLIDCLDSVPFGKQQNVRTLLESLDQHDVRFVFTCHSPNKLIKDLQKQAYLLPIKRLPQVDMLKIALTICVNERIGYEKAGIEELFTYTGDDLGKIYRTLQTIFVKYAYLSYDNVIKVTNPEMAFQPLVVDAAASIMPLERCPRCTLVPPCKHITEFDLAERGKQRRRELPKRGEGSLNCARFAETGCCPTFNKLGRCSCNHPNNIHTIRYPPKRCPVCSLPKPCNKCEYTKRRTELESFLNEKRTALKGVYKKRKEELIELANTKLKINSGHADKEEAISSKLNTCTEALEKLTLQVEQVQGWLNHNPDCVDNQLFENKRKWIGKNVENAFYVVDRALHDWGSNRARGASNTKDGGGGGRRRRRK
mmetsp:Transcript_10372/g.18781  ORF Transcript_10372/g.18781 Transcript_10372/m.18781 type:complete len:588 (-) Transcript_10372:41-1804(-)